MCISSSVRSRTGCQRYLAILHSLLVFNILISPTYSDFTYPDFNQTLGLVFNGDATTNDCGWNNSYVSQNDANEQQHYNSFKENYTHNPNLTKLPLHGDESTCSTNTAAISRVSVSKIGTQGGFEIQYTTETNDDDDDDNEDHPQFGHLDFYQPSILTGCSSRLRLTPSLPSKVGSVWYEKRVPVLKGFETKFSFQITGHSRVCADHVEPMYSLKHHKSCAVHGGDGFAFVLHADEQYGTKSIGLDGKELGYGGISNSLAIEFDMWTNVDTEDSDDYFHDHISIHSMSVQPNSAGSSTALGYSRAVNLADGVIHTARIVYLPYLEIKYLESMTANPNLLPYLKDNGEGRRLGTLAIFIDDGLSSNIPLLAIPLNLSVLLHLPQSLAYVGFTASTGSKWEKHDIISWDWCDSIDCHGNNEE